MGRLLAILLAGLPISGQSTDWRAGVVQVSAKGKSPGSGFVAAVRSGQAYIVTCAHVVNGDPKPEVTVTFRAAPEERYTAEVRDLQGEARDSLALLVVDKPPTNVRALEAGTDAGAPVDFAGYPVSLGSFTVVSAKIASVKGTDFYLDRDAPEGFSGGPVVQGGHMLGIVFGRTGGFGSAVRAAIVAAYLEGLGLRWDDGLPKARERTAELAAGTVRENPKDGLKYVWVPPGKFLMGCSPGSTDCYDNEKPPREMTIPQGFWIGQTAVTQATYERLTGKNPSSHKGARKPVESVSWIMAQDYCGKVGLRLPTEAEWEYAARAGNPRSRYGELDSIAWYRYNSDSQTHEVGQKLANAWGLYDMLGNVYEWTADQYPGRTERILRGNGYYSEPKDVHVSWRSAFEEQFRSSNLGFRCAGELP